MATRADTPTMFRPSAKLSGNGYQLAGACPTEHKALRWRHGARWRFTASALSRKVSSLSMHVVHPPADLRFLRLRPLS